MITLGSGGKKMNNSLTIRRMEPRDIDAVMALGQWLITRHELTAIDLGGPSDLSFISEMNNQVIGFILARLEYLGIPFTEVCVIHSIMVDHDHRGQRIGNQLMIHLLDYCRYNGIQTVRALVPEKNQELLRFVDSLGFRQSDIKNFDFQIEAPGARIGTMSTGRIRMNLS
jgi:ribosomal protein S18 acetylase RimI-like enzyme